MATQAHEHEAATTRLAELGVATEMLQRALLRADAEAAMVTGLEPPTSEGTTRYAKTVRFLREELLPAGWGYDNGRNFCRTIHPSAEFAIVVSSGDDTAGVLVPGTAPSTKYPKGDLTENAVHANAQPALDLGIEFEPPAEEATGLVWLLLQRVSDDLIYYELSLPTRIENGQIRDWKERIIFDPIDRHEPLPESGDVQDPPDEDGYSVEVSPR